ncbi:hypothetical protein ABLO27_04800 [Roseibium sp. SCPC15]|uniref:hypothetical protein n=1 Tax=Roseibium sp. SCP15 TaxID=3141376 RepID=UPI0033389C05
MVLFLDHGITHRRTNSAPATSGYTRSPAALRQTGQRNAATSVINLTTLLALAAVVFAASAHAQNVSCTCRYQGEDYGLGESICLKSPSGLKMATCEMVLNNTSWQISNAPCPVTNLQDEMLKGADEAPQAPITPVKPDELKTG